MKKADLKKLIKPIVKECINEVLIEEGLLSNVVAEVAKGLQGNTIVESVNPPRKKANQDDAQMKRKRAEVSSKLAGHRKKMMDAIGNDAYNGVNLFEGTTPTPASQESQSGASDLGSPVDPGVDISSLVGGASQIWKAMK